MEKLSGTSKVWRFLLNIFILGLLVFFLVSFQLTREVLPATGSGEEEVMVEIPQGATSAEVAGILQEEEVVRNQIAFSLYANYMGYAHKLQAGKYEFSPGMTLKEIMDKLARGEVVIDSITVTIPEGLHKEQVAQRLEDHDVTRAESFLECAREEFFDFWFLQEGEGEGGNSSLEGYLFPDTYQIQVEWEDREIIELLLNRFDEVFDDSYQDRAEELGLAVHEVVTLASIIEREAMVKEEQPLVSAVFHRRLERDMLLQSCATVQYVLGEVKPVLTYQDLEVESPYNTYTNYGLPPGPIASPGKGALEAALYPADTKYLYFVLKGDGSGEHYFSETLGEHLDYRDKANRERAERNQDNPEN